MATRALIGSTPSFMDIRPNYIRPSAGDVEEARVKRLLDMATLHKIQLEPEFEQRRLALAERGLGLDKEKAATAKELGLRGQDIDMRGQDIQTRGQDVTMRGQDIAEKSNAEELRQRTLSHILGTLISRPEFSVEQGADVLSQFGFPEVATSLKNSKNQEQDDKAKKLLTGLITAQKSGDTTAYNEFLNTVKSHPESADLVPRIMKSVPSEYESLKVDLDPKKPGVQTTGPNYSDPELIAARSRTAAQTAATKAEADRIRRLGEHFRARKRAGLKTDSYDPTTPFIVPGYLH